MCEAVTPDTPLETPYNLPAKKYIDFLSARRPEGYDVHSIGTIVGYYIDISAMAKIDAIFPIAQMIHETGALSSWWSQRPRRNPAGIGVTGKTSNAKVRPGLDWVWNEQRKLWVQGHTFTDWNKAALAHYGHILAYMLTENQLIHDDRKIIVACDPRASAIPTKNRGVVKTLRGFNGTWAVPGITYADRITKIANAIRG